MHGIGSVVRDVEKTSIVQNGSKVTFGALPFRHVLNVFCRSELRITGFVAGFPDDFEDATAGNFGVKMTRVRHEKPRQLGEFAMSH